MKRQIIWISVFIILIAICFGFMFIQDRGNFATIKSDGKVLYELDLNSVSEPYDITVEYNGHFNIVRVEHGNIYVLSADCPDKLCMHQANINMAPIVCLPNKLIISTEKNVLDAVA